MSVKKIHLMEDRTMKKQSTRRVNVFLTEKEDAALSILADEYQNRGLSMNMSDIIREAILQLAEKETNYKVRK